MANTWKLPLSLLATPPICDKCKLFHKVMARPESRKANGFEDDRRESWYFP